MSLIIATGTNVGHKKNNLTQVIEKLKKYFILEDSSRVYKSEPVDYLEQDYFYNQILQFEIPKQKPNEVLSILKSIEKEMGRNKVIDKGPRLIDIDIIFWGTDKINQANLSVPHPSWTTRSFVVIPLKEIFYFKTLEKSFKIPTTFENKSWPLT